MDSEYKSKAGELLCLLSKKECDKDLRQQARKLFSNINLPKTIFDTTSKRYYSAERFIDRLCREGSHEINVETIELDKKSCKILEMEILAVELE